MDTLVISMLEKCQRNTFLMKCKYASVATEHVVICVILQGKNHFLGNWHVMKGSCAKN